MAAYLYVWDSAAGQWCFNDILDTEEQARTKARGLWKQGAPGIRIDLVQTVVQEKRNGSRNV